MTTAEAVELIAALAALDPRMFPADPSRQALVAEGWRATVDPAIPARFVGEHARRHYSSAADPLTPSEVNRAWQDAEQRTRVRRLDSERHCGRADCSCTHDRGCTRGWVDGPATSAPCPRCRPWLARRVADVPPPGQRGPGDLAHLSGAGEVDDVPPPAPLTRPPDPPDHVERDPGRVAARWALIRSLAGVDPDDAEARMAALIGSQR